MVRVDKNGRKSKANELDFCSDTALLSELKALLIFTCKIPLELLSLKTDLMEYIAASTPKD